MVESETNDQKNSDDKNRKKKLKRKQFSMSLVICRIVNVDGVDE